MPKEVMISGNWLQQVQKSANSKLIELPPLPISVAVDFDTKNYALLGKDPILIQKLKDAGTAEYKALINEGVTALRGCEAHLLRAAHFFNKKNASIDLVTIEIQSAKISLVQLIHKLATEGKKKIEKAILAAFQAYKNLKKLGRDYKIRVVAKIGLKLASMSFSIGRLITTSGTDVLAWRGLVKDAVLTLTEAGKYMMSAEKFRKKTAKQFETIKGWHKKLGDGKGATASEVGFGILKSAIGTDGELTLNSLGANVAQYRTKLKQVELKAHETATKLNIVLNRIASASKELDKDLKTQLQTMTERVNGLIANVHDAFAEIEAGVLWADRIEETIKGMKSAKNVKQMGIFVKALDSASDVAAGAASWSKVAESGKALGLKLGKQAIVVGKNVDRWIDDVKKLRKKMTV